MLSMINVISASFISVWI